MKAAASRQRDLSREYQQACRIRIADCQVASSALSAFSAEEGDDGHSHAVEFMPVNSSEPPAYHGGTTFETHEESPSPESTDDSSLASTDRHGGIATEPSRLGHLATRAVRKASQLYHGGLALTPLAMQLVRDALLEAKPRVDTSLQKLVEIACYLIPKALKLLCDGQVVSLVAAILIKDALRLTRDFVESAHKAICTTLVASRDILTAEKTTVGSDHAPVPGAFSTMAEAPKVAAEEHGKDDVASELAPDLAPAKAARFQTDRMSLKRLLSTRLSSSMPRGLGTGKLLFPAKPRFGSPYPKSSPPYNLRSPEYVRWMEAEMRLKSFACPKTRSAFDIYPSLAREFNKRQIRQDEIQRNLERMAETPVYVQHSPFDSLGVYWAERLSPLLGVDRDGKEYPVFQPTPFQLQRCHMLVQMCHADYKLLAAVLLRPDLNQVCVFATVQGPFDRGLIRAFSSDGLWTWDHVDVTDECGGASQTVYHPDSIAFLLEDGEPMDLDGGE